MCVWRVHFHRARRLRSSFGAKFGVMNGDSKPSERPATAPNCNSRTLWCVREKLQPPDERPVACVLRLIFIARTAAAQWHKEAEQVICNCNVSSLFGIVSHVALIIYAQRIKSPAPQQVVSECRACTHTHSLPFSSRTRLYIFCLLHCTCTRFSQR